MENINDFIAGAVTTILCIGVGILSYFIFNPKERDVNPLPTATTMEFEGHNFIVFYDYKGDICEITEYYDYEDEDFD